MEAARGMSFRARFLAIIVLSAVVFAATALTFVQLREETDAAREAAAEQRGDAIVTALLQHVAQRALGATPALSPEEGRAFTEVADLVLAQSPDGSAGLCTHDGALLLTRSIAPPP